MLPNPFPSTYRIGEDGVTLCTSFAPQKDLTYFNDETNNCQRTVRRHDRYLNRGIRRELCYLFSGDSPVFGFGLAQKVYDNQAPLLNMGEFTFSLVENRYTAAADTDGAYNRGAFPQRHPLGNRACRGR